MSRTINLEDKLVVGAAESGHELIASLVGQYISTIYNKSAESLFVSSSMKEIGWHSLTPSTLSTGYVTETNSFQLWENIEPHFTGSSDKVIFVKRDLKDEVASQIHTTFPAGEEITTEILDGIIRNVEVCKERLLTLGSDYTTVTFEELVESPHTVLTRILHELRPFVDFKISMESVEEVVSASEVRGLRLESDSNFKEKVGVWSTVLTQEQADYIDQKALELNL